MATCPDAGAGSTGLPAVRHVYVCVFCLVNLALHYAVHYEAEADGGMYAAAVDGAAAGVCVARCVYPCLFPGEDADWGGVWDGDAEARQLARLRGCVGDMAGVGPDDYLLGLACADDDPRDDEVGDAAAHGLLGAGF